MIFIARYNMYAMVCHSGVLGGGHYVSYSKTEEEQWFCQNDSACKKVIYLFNSSFHFHSIFLL